MNTTDFRQRFVFDDRDLRGCLVRLQDTVAEIQSTHHYPANLAKLLNQFALAAALLRDSIKIEGSLTIQLRSKGSISLIMADCLADRRIRAIAEYDAERLAPNDALLLNQMGDGAVLAITITPDEGERYQSIVPIDGDNLADCLQDYFARSEQLPSLFNFFADEHCAMGIALHALPAAKTNNEDDDQAHFERLGMLLKTLTIKEAFELDSEAILTRLFHQERCRLFDSYPIEFGCLCSAEKSLHAIKSLGQDDIDKLITEQQQDGNQALVVDCHFCFQRYEFEFDQLRGLFI